MAQTGAIPGLTIHDVDGGVIGPPHYTGPTFPVSLTAVKRPIERSPAAIKPRIRSSSDLCSPPLKRSIPLEHIQHTKSHTHMHIYTHSHTHAHIDTYLPAPNHRHWTTSCLTTMITTMTVASSSSDHLLSMLDQHNMEHILDGIVSTALMELVLNEFKKVKSLADTDSRGGPAQVPIPSSECVLFG